jgi:hypothetical protein
MYSNNQNNNSYNSYRNNNNMQQNQQQQQFKKSGATYSKITKGNSEGFLIVNAWRMTAAGLMTAKATPMGDFNDKREFLGVTVHVGKDKGNEFVRYKVEVLINGVLQKFYTLMRLDTKKISIRELNLVISPTGQGMTKSGKRVTGYFGSNYVKK